MKTSIASLPLKLRLMYEKFYETNLVRISRHRDCKRNLEGKRRQSKPLTAAQRQDILAYWSPFTDVKRYMSWFEFYNTVCEDSTQLKYYIPDAIHFADIDAALTSPRRSAQLDDKNLYDLYFHDVNRPETVMRKVNGELLDKDYRPITREQAMALYAQAGSVVSKESKFAVGGHSIRFHSMDTCQPTAFLQSLEGKEDMVIQQLLQQHETLSRIHRESINTIRIMSLLLDGETHILSSVLRMGKDGARVDNASSGGLVCGINDDGTLKDVAFDKNGNRCSEHPQGGAFKGIKIEGFDKCCGMVKELAGRMCTTSRLISWDLSIDPAGEPVLIEVNLSYGELDFHQLCNGPVFGPLTTRVLERVFQHAD